MREIASFLAMTAGAGGSRFKVLSFKVLSFKVQGSFVQSSFVQSSKFLPEPETWNLKLET